MAIIDTQDDRKSSDYLESSFSDRRYPSESSDFDTTRHHDDDYDEIIRPAEEEQAGLLGNQQPPPSYHEVVSDPHREDEATQPKRSCPPTSDVVGARSRRCKRWLVASLSAMAIGAFVIWVLLLCSSRNCRMQSFSTSHYQIESLHHFDFGKSHHQNSGLPKGFSGSMVIATGPSDQDVDLNVSVRSVESDFKHASKYGATWRPEKLSSCAQVILFFRSGLEISTLSIKSHRMDLTLSATDLVVLDKTTISLKNGRFTSEEDSGYSSRRTHIDVGNSRIQGAIKLHDELFIKTKSGSVDVDVQPQPAAAKDGATKATLKVKSKSGHVRINYPAHMADIPAREYHTSVESRAGSVSGTFLHGKNTKLETRSGNLDAKIVPYGLDEESHLTTEMRSGSSVIELLPPFLSSAKSLGRLTSSHSVRSGNLRLKYPDEWQGTIKAEARSGNLEIRGEDVQITNQRVRGASKDIKATKGHGESELKIELRSGSFDVLIGS